jgi:hypothetical protein
VPTADEYRRLAAECVALAPRISPDLRDIFIALAQGWVHLAAYLDDDHSILPDMPATGENETPENSVRDTADSGEDYRSGEDRKCERQNPGPVSSSSRR